MKQTLKDLEHRINSDIGSIIVQYEQGNIEALNKAQIKAKSDFQKHADEMQKIAQQLGDNYVSAVREFLDSADTLIHTNSTWIDADKIRTCYTMRERLEKTLSTAA